MAIKKNIVELLKEAGIPFDFVGGKPLPKWLEEGFEEVWQYVQAKEKAHKRAANSKLHYRGQRGAELSSTS